MIGAILLLGLADASAPSTSALDSVALWREHESRRSVTIPAPCLTPELLSSEIARLHTAHPKPITVETIGAEGLVVYADENEDEAEDGPGDPPDGVASPAD